MLMGDWVVARLNQSRFFKSMASSVFLVVGSSSRAPLISGHKRRTAITIFIFRWWKNEDEKKSTPHAFYPKKSWDEKIDGPREKKVRNSSKKKGKKRKILDNVREMPLRARDSIPVRVSGIGRHRVDFLITFRDIVLRSRLTITGGKIPTSCHPKGSHQIAILIVQFKFALVWGGGRDVWLPISNSNLRKFLEF